MGLRALYFLLAGVVDLFRYLHYGLAAVLGFVGVKMIAESPLFAGWTGLAEGEHLVPIWVSLLVIALLLAVSILLSVLVARHDKS